MKQLPVHQQCFDKFQCSLFDSLSLSPQVDHHVWMHSSWQGLSSFNFSFSASPSLPRSIASLSISLWPLRKHWDTPGVLIKELFRRVKTWVFVKLALLRREQTLVYLRPLSGPVDQGHQEENWQLNLQQATCCLNCFDQLTRGLRGESYIVLFSDDAGVLRIVNRAQEENE